MLSLHLFVSSSQCVIKISEEYQSRNDTAGTYLPDSDSRGSSVNASALKSKGSASCRSSIRSLSVLLLALVYLDAAVKEEKNMLTKKYVNFSIVFMGPSLWIFRKKSQDYKGSEF